jgi:hypothetical protein
MARVVRKNDVPTSEDEAETWSSSQLRKMDEKYTSRVRVAKAMPSAKPQAVQHVQARLKKLDGNQLRTLLAASQVIRQAKREAFLLAVAHELGDRAEVGDGDVDRAVRAAMTSLHLERAVTL